MAEVQKTVQTGEMTQRFIEFVMMHAQNAALFLGQIPNPRTGFSCARASTTYRIERTRARIAEEIHQKLRAVARPGFAEIILAECFCADLEVCRLQCRIRPKIWTFLLKHPKIGPNSR